jgi:HTH-type transcriptional regulator/antitoxin HigA
MGRPVRVIGEIIHGQRAITPEMALQLEGVLEIPAYLWLRLEATYRLGLALLRTASKPA